MRTRLVTVLVCLVSLTTAGSALAQTGGTGSLRGTVVDEQGAAMPGVTVTASAPEAIAPGVAVTDASGMYRIINLTPGTYTLTAELTGFAVSRREGVLLRTGTNFQVDDIPMKLGTLEEAITVSGESPMLEVSSPTTQMHLDADFQRVLPLVESRYWSDFLQMTPGVLTRGHNDGSGRQNYFALGVEHREHNVQMEGLFAGNYNDFNVNRTGLSSEALQDTQVKTGGVDASTPMGYGLAMNMVSKSGGNQFSGSIVYAFQPFAWNGNNAGPDALPTNRKVNQTDFSIGGPIRQDKAWFFAAYQISRNSTDQARTAANVANFEAFAPGVEPPTNILSGNYPWVKVTTKLSPNHDLIGVYQEDRLQNWTAAPTQVSRFTRTDTGGSMIGGTLRSVFGTSVTTTFAANYNNKGGNSRDSYSDDLNNLGARQNVHNSAVVDAGVATGSGLLLEMGGQGQMNIDSSSFVMLRGDVTWFKSGGMGSHEIQTGFLAMPRSHYDGQTTYLNNGFHLEELKQVNPNDPSAGLVPFHRQVITSELTLATAAGRDHDYGVYVQDTWRPSERLTATFGVRVDKLRRYDPNRDLTLQSSVEVAPRMGFTYLLTDDGKNVVRSSFARMHRQLMGGRDGVASFGGADAASFDDQYDLDGNGTFETVYNTPARSRSTSALQFDPNFTQPYIDEFIVGYQRQFPANISVDVAVTTKTYNLQYGQVEINGFWPEGPNQPFGGFGRVDPNAGQLFQVTNRTWADTKYKAMQVAVAKNMSHNVQFMTSFHYQWQHLSPTGDPNSPLGWNPTDPARFISPDAYPNDKNIWRDQGIVDHNSLTTGGALINNPIWGRYSFRLAGTWHAPGGLITSANWTAVSGNYTGPIIDQLPANDPSIRVFGPPNVISSTGVRQSNPLATRIRFAFPTRAEGQVLSNSVHTVGFKIAKVFELGGARSFMTGFNVFNLLNGGQFTEWNRDGANRLYSPSVYLTMENQQPARSFQLDATFRF